jgi:hypothetical protein
MRTETVRILSYRAGMINPQVIGTPFIEFEARQRQQQLRDAAQQVRRTRHAHRARRRRLRVRAGWLLVQAGVRLALSGEGSPVRPSRRALVATHR